MSGCWGFWCGLVVFVWFDGFFLVAVVDFLGFRSIGVWDVVLG